MRLEVAQIWLNNAAQLSKPCTKSKDFYVNNAATATEMLGSSSPSNAAFRKGHGSATTGPHAITRRSAGAVDSPPGNGSFMTVRHQVH